MRKLLIFIVLLLGAGLVLQYLSIHNKMPTKITRLDEMIDFSETAKIEINTRSLRDEGHKQQLIEDENAVRSYAEYWGQRKVKRASNDKEDRLDTRTIIDFLNDKDQLVARITITGEKLIKLDYPTYPYIHVVTNGLELNSN